MVLLLAPGHRLLLLQLLSLLLLLLVLLLLPPEHRLQGLSSGCGCCLQSVLGEGASVVLEGQKVISSRTQDAGFKFRYNSLQDALLKLR